MYTFKKIINYGIIMYFLLVKIYLQVNFCFSFYRRTMAGTCFSGERHSQYSGRRREAREISTCLEEEKAKRTKDSKRETKSCEEKRPRDKRLREGLLQFSSTHNPFQLFTSSPVLDTSLGLWLSLETFSIFPLWIEEARQKKT